MCHCIFIAASHTADMQTNCYGDASEQARVMRLSETMGKWHFEYFQELQHGTVSWEKTTLCEKPLYEHCQTADCLAYRNHSSPLDHTVQHANINPELATFWSVTYFISHEEVIAWLVMEKLFFFVIKKKTGMKLYDVNLLNVFVLSCLFWRVIMQFEPWLDLILKLYLTKFEEHMWLKNSSFTFLNYKQCAFLSE